MNRLANVAGSFYPNDCNEIKRYFTHFNQIIKDNNIHFAINNIKAIIVPHAGYIYSGFTANLAYNLVQNQSYKRVIIIGPSHRFNFKGASIGFYDKFITPCKSLSIDIQYAKKLKNDFKFLEFYPASHIEHSTETQAPFIQYYLDIPIVEIIYSNIDYNQLALLVEYVLQDKNNLLVISTDLSHFYNLAKANKLDNYCIKAIQNLDLSIWDQGCEACGRVGVKALIKVANNMKLNPTILDYRTSYDASGDKNRVVGYVSAVFN